MIALLLALALLTTDATAPAVTPVTAATPAYLAYRVRLARHEASYRLDSGLSALAARRAVEISEAWDHRWLNEVPCQWGEILGWTIHDVPWVMAAWRHSPTHWAVLTAAWRYYGVGTYQRDGATYMAVVFAQCRV